eukprot:gene8831-5165_t
MANKVVKKYCPVVAATDSCADAATAEGGSLAAMVRCSLQSLVDTYRMQKVNWELY